jgi:hypothetical protein
MPDALTDQERAAIVAFPARRIQRIPRGVSGGEFAHMTRAEREMHRARERVAAKEGRLFEFHGHKFLSLRSIAKYYGVNEGFVRLAHASGTLAQLVEDAKSGRVINAKWEGVLDAAGDNRAGGDEPAARNAAR